MTNYNVHSLLIVTHLTLLLMGSGDSTTRVLNTQMFSAIYLRVRYHVNVTQWSSTVTNMIKFYLPKNITVTYEPVLFAKKYSVFFAKQAQVNIPLKNIFQPVNSMTMVGITIVSPSTTTFDAQSTTDPLIPRIWRNSP